MDQKYPFDHLVGYATDIGLRHSKNQDAGGAWTWETAGGVPLSLAVVADGVSAGRHSEQASGAAVRIVHHALGRLAAFDALALDDVAGALLQGAENANHAVAGEPGEARDQGDSTTLVAVAVLGEDGAGVWCGDSRAYIVEGEAAVLLTEDHSWAESVVRQGLMTREDAAHDPRAHMITRWIGPPSGRDPGIESFRFRMNPESTVLCCSDGLYAYFSPPQWSEGEMAVIIADRADLDAGVRALVTTALDRGGNDNITAAAIGLRANVAAQRHHAAFWRRDLRT